jgi:hypothetical protein
MAHSKATLKSRGDKASPCFKPFQTGKLSEMFAYIDFTARFD